MFRKEVEMIDFFLLFKSWLYNANEKFCLEKKWIFKYS